MKKLFIFFTFLSLVSCRSAKPVTSIHAQGDTLSSSYEASLTLRQDSSASEEKSEAYAHGLVKFIDSGGSVSLSPGGSISMSGVASVKASLQHTSESAKTEKGLSILTRSEAKDTSAHQLTSIHESKPSDSVFRDGLKLRTGISLFIIMTIVIIAFRIWRNLKK